MLNLPLEVEPRECEVRSIRNLHGVVALVVWRDVDRSRHMSVAAIRPAIGRRATDEPNTIRSMKRSGRRSRGGEYDRRQCQDDLEEKLGRSD